MKKTWKTTTILCVVFLIIFLLLNSDNRIRISVMRFYESRGDGAKAVQVYKKIYRKDAARYGWGSLRLFTPTEKQLLAEHITYYYQLSDIQQAHRYLAELQKTPFAGPLEYLSCQIFGDLVNGKMRKITAMVLDAGAQDILPGTYRQSPFWYYNAWVVSSEKHRAKEAHVFLQRLQESYPYIRFLDGSFPIGGDWDFNEEADIPPKDASGRWYNGAVVFQAQRTEGRCGNGLYFDGVADYVQIARQAHLSSRDFTLLAWVKPSTIHSGMVLRNGQIGYLKVHQRGYLEAGFYDGAQWHEIHGGTYQPGSWTHAACVLQNGVLTLYQDGRVVAGPYDFAKRGVSQTDYDLFIGKREDGIERFAGVIDEVKLFNRSLTESEVSRARDSICAE